MMLHHIELLVDLASNDSEVRKKVVLGSKVHHQQRKANKTRLQSDQTGKIDFNRWTLGLTDLEQRAWADERGSLRRRNQGRLEDLVLTNHRLCHRLKKPPNSCTSVRLPTPERRRTGRSEKREASSWTMNVGEQRSFVFFFFFLMNAASSWDNGSFFLWKDDTASTGNRRQRRRAEDGEIGVEKRTVFLMGGGRRERTLGFL